MKKEPSLKERVACHHLWNEKHPSDSVEAIELASKAGGEVEARTQAQSHPMTDERPELSVVMPCLNEAETLAVCIDKAIETLRDHGISGEVIIADNGSTDGSQTIAVEHGSRLVRIASRGYGNALIGGIEAARGTYVIMGDSDDSYDYHEIPQLLEKLREGYDLVMGNRFRGGIKPGAMPPLHRYLGNPVLTFIGRLFFRTPPCGDFHCGLRGFRKAAADRMDLRTTGMEFATEMVIKATLHKMRIAEVPVTLSPDGRSRPPHLRSWRDGWRHLRFMLLYSPRWLFLYPGFALMALGMILGLVLLPGPLTVGSVTFDVHTLLYSAILVLIGYQAVLFAVFSKVYAVISGLLPPDPRLEKLFRYVSLEAGLAVGGVLLALGLAGTIAGVSIWGGASFGPLDFQKMMRLLVPTNLALVLGFQTVLSSFFLSVLGMGRR